MNVIVVGGGKVGRKLVEDFNYEGDDVVLIDIKSKICDRIQDDYDVRLSLIHISEPTRRS